MKYRPLGNTGITVSEVGFGSNTISGQGTLGVVEEEQGAAAVQHAYDRGITFFDTAESYSDGRSEEVIGRVLGNKKDVVICTKIGANGGPITPERMRPAAEASLQRLRRGAIDVYLLHNPTTEEIEDPNIKEALKALLQDGLIRSYGVSL
ncbi:MAG: aldo/keto reductase [Chloroflexi bacterium]|nr:aldo/keto reductase [Chloroflexota bacterium]